MILSVICKYPARVCAVGFDDPEYSPDVIYIVPFMIIASCSLITHDRMTILAICNQRRKANFIRIISVPTFINPCRSSTRQFARIQPKFHARTCHPFWIQLSPTADPVIIRFPGSKPGNGGTIKSFLARTEWSGVGIPVR